MLIGVGSMCSLLINVFVVEAVCVLIVSVDTCGVRKLTVMIGRPFWDLINGRRLQGAREDYDM